MNVTVFGGRYIGKHIFRLHLYFKHCRSLRTKTFEKENYSRICATLKIISNFFAQLYCSVENVFGRFYYVDHFLCEGMSASIE